MMVYRQYWFFRDMLTLSAYLIVAFAAFAYLTWYFNSVGVAAVIMSALVILKHVWTNNQYR